MKKLVRTVYRVAIIFVLTNVLTASVSLAQDLKRIVLLETMDVKVVRDRSHWFRVQMKDLGYIEGVNMMLTVLKASGSYARAESLLKAHLSKNHVDLVVTNATLASQAAVKLLKDTSIPQLFMTVADPVGAGIVKDIGVPSGKNITGRVYNISSKTKIKIVLQLVEDKLKRRPIRFGYIHSSYPSSVGDLKLLQTVAKENKNITFIPYEIEYREIPENIDYMLLGLEKGLQQLEGQIDFIWEPLGPFAESIEYNKRMVNLATVPVVFGINEESLQVGVLMHLSPDPEGEGREVGMLADKILAGAWPGDIPVIPPIKFNLGINLTSADKMGIVVPPSILELAGKNLYREGL